MSGHRAGNTAVRSSLAQSAPALPCKVCQRTLREDLDQLWQRLFNAILQQRLRIITLVERDVQRGSVVCVAEDVGDVGADGELHTRVDYPGVLAALVRVEQMVQTGSPVVILSLLTLPVSSVEVGHPPLLQGEDICLVSPQVE